MIRYPTKRDLWLMAILWAAAAICIFAVFDIQDEPVAPWMRVFATVFFGVFSVFSVAMVILPYYTEYIIDGEFLIIKVGPFKGKIRLSEISEVYPTWNPLSAPAWSLKRVRIRYDSSRFGALISPDPRDRFISDLASRVPSLEKQGERLVRRTSANEHER